jgi:hypothetical protein
MSTGKSSEIKSINVFADGRKAAFVWLPSTPAEAGRRIPLPSEDEFELKAFWSTLAGGKRCLLEEESPGGGRTAGIPWCSEGCADLDLEMPPPSLPKSRSAKPAAPPSWSREGPSPPIALALMGRDRSNSGLRCVAVGAVARPEPAGEDPRNRSEPKSRWTAPELFVPFAIRGVAVAVSTCSDSE